MQPLEVRVRAGFVWQGMAGVLAIGSSEKVVLVAARSESVVSEVLDDVSRVLALGVMAQTLPLKMRGDVRL
jgi:hypothetical protein